MFETKKVEVMPEPVKTAEDVIKDRQPAYGDPAVMFGKIAKGWGALLNIEIKPETVGLMMSWLKMCRESHAHSDDNVLDLEAYIKLYSVVREDTINRILERITEEGLVKAIDTAFIAGRELEPPEQINSDNSKINTRQVIENEKMIEAIRTILNMSYDSGRPGCKWGDTDYDSESVSYGYNLCLDYIQGILKASNLPTGLIIT